MNRPDIGMARRSPPFNDAVNMENAFVSVKEKSARNRHARPEMKGPENINDLLAGLKTKKINIQGPKVSDQKSTISLSELKEMKDSIGAPPRSKRKPRSERNTIQLNL